MWQPEGGHLGDVTTISIAAPNLLATGATDGFIKIWNTNLMKVVSEFSPREAIKQRVPSARQSSHVQSLLSAVQKTPIDKILWLCSRIKLGRRLKCASLISSGQGGLCQFWSPFKSTLVGWFSAAHSKLANEVSIMMSHQVFHTSFQFKLSYIPLTRICQSYISYLY